MTIRNISRDKYYATPVHRSVKYVLEASIGGLPTGGSTLETILEWRILSEAELAASESSDGTLMSQSTAEWIIKKRSVSAGIHQVKFTASVTVGNPSAPRMLQAFDYGFIESIPGPLRAIIDGGTSVRWGSAENVTVDGSLSYDGDIGPGTHSRVNFVWSCTDIANSSMSYDCFGAFVFDNVNATTMKIATSQLVIGKSYVLELEVSKDTRRASTKMSFEIAAGQVPQVTLRYEFF